MIENTEALLQNKNERISVRVTNTTYSKLQAFAKAHKITISKAVLFLIDEGLKAQNQEPAATKADIEHLLNKQKTIQELTKFININDTKKQYIEKPKDMKGSYINLNDWVIYPSEEYEHIYKINKVCSIDYIFNENNKTNDATLWFIDDGQPVNAHECFLLPKEIISTLIK